MKRFALALLLLAACRPQPSPSSSGNPLPIASHPELCDASCAHLRDLHCPEGDASPGGHTCEEVCGQLADMIDTQCIVDASRATLPACHVRCVP